MEGGAAPRTLDPGLLYFAYGCNMDPAVLARVVGRELAPGWPARLAGWHLAFNLVEDDGGEARVANLMERPSCITYGVVYRLPRAVLRELDAFLGAPALYRRSTLWVRPLGRRATQAVVVYLGQPHRVVSAGAPSADYLAALLRGAKRHSLPSGYGEWLTDVARGSATDCYLSDPG